MSKVRIKTLKFSSLFSRKLLHTKLRIPGYGVNQLLGAEVIQHGTGVAQATEVDKRLSSWGCREEVGGGCADTTASNTGPDKGAFVKLEVLLGKVLIFLACRHHLLEIIPKHLFDQLIESSSSPDIGVLCKSFKQKWPSMNQQNFKPGIDDPSVRVILTETKVKNILKFANDTLKVRKTKQTLNFPFFF